MRVLILTNEYPPHVYGGAGVHVQHLSRELSRLCEVQVYPFGDQQSEEPNLSVQGVPLTHPIPTREPSHAGVFNALSRNLEMAARYNGPQVVHCHTWYTHFGGILVREAHHVPLVLTTHSLEPSRPWKAEQLGAGGYRLSSWIERMAFRMADGVVAVSQEMRHDVQGFYGVPSDRIRVIHNGVNPDEFTDKPNVDLLRRFGIDPERPYALFVGRITRQKGIHHFLRAARHLDSSAQIVLCAAAPDTPQMAAEVEEAVRDLQAARGGVVWVREAVPVQDLPSFYAGATVFCCPSIYEPFGITNLEAMACRTPVVASKVGGIPEIVVEGETGFLIPFDHASVDDPEAKDPDAFALALADAMNRILTNPDLAHRMGEASRRRIEEKFSWASIARQTLDYYHFVAKNFRP